MTVSDWSYVVLIAAFLVADHFTWPAFLRRVRRDEGSARIWLWSAWMSLQWPTVAVGIALWLFHERSWSALGLILPGGWRMWASLLPILGFVLYQARTAAKIARIKGPKPRMRAQLGDLSIALPHTRSELRSFVALSLTAGFCEEFLFRGYLIWALRPWLGWWGAAALSLPMFMAAHAYQGKAGVVQTGLLGTLFTLLVAISGSLV